MEHCLQTLEHKCTLSHQKGVCKVSDTHLLGCLKILGKNIAVVLLLTNMSLKFEHGSDEVSIYLVKVGWSYLLALFCYVQLPIVMYHDVCYCLHVKCSFYNHFNTRVHIGPSWLYFRIMMCNMSTGADTGGRGGGYRGCRPPSSRRNLRYSKLNTQSGAPDDVKGQRVGLGRLCSKTGLLCYAAIPYPIMPHSCLILLPGAYAIKGRYFCI